MSNLEYDILKTILYYDIFNHPIRIDEIYRYLPTKHSFESLLPKLNQLVDTQELKIYDEYYGLGDIEKNVKNRISNNKSAKKIMSKAIENGNLIKSFPFVVGVFISGGLSKGVFNEQTEDADDIDYFIIAKKNRLWIAKFAIKFYKYFYLKNSKKYFCVNYYITEEDLKIPEENIYTATELITLIPIASNKQFSQLLAENAWTLSYLPHAEAQLNILTETHIPKNTVARFIEGICIGPIGYLIDHLLMALNQLRNYVLYYKKYKDLNYNLRFRSNKKESKIHPESHQARFLKEYATRIDLIKFETSDV